MTDRDRARAGFARVVGALAALGLAHASAEWTPRFALHAVGRGPFAAALPPALGVIAFLGSLALLLGRHPRVAALGCALALAALHALVPATYHNNYYLLWLYLGAVALDSPKEPQWSSSGVPLVLSLVRAQVAVVYVASVVAKLAHPWWRSGGGVVHWIVTARVPPTGPGGIVNPLLATLFAHPALAAAAQWGVIAMELLLPIGLFHPRWRRPALVLGALLHGLMQQWLFPQLFTFLMLLGYHAFGPLGTRGWTLTAPPGHLLHRALPTIDVFSRIRPLEGPALGLTTPQGRVYTGPSALWWLGVITPAGVIAGAALSLSAPETTTVLGLPRATFENLLVIAVALLGLIPGKHPSHREGTPAG